MQSVLDVCRACFQYNIGTRRGHNRRSFIDTVMRASLRARPRALQYKDHPPIEAINELLRQCSQSGPEMENVHKVSLI